MAEPRLIFHTSNRLEVLVAELARALADAPLEPLEREVVVVQSQGMARWVTLELARRLGIAAGLSLPFPRTFCHRLAERLLAGEVPAGEAPSTTPAFARDVLAWRVFALLGDGAADPFPGLAAYLDDDPDQRKRFGLARRLAALYDDYQLYRPDLLLAWEEGPPPPADGDAAWQAALWRRLVEDAGEDPAGGHLARRIARLVERLERPGPPPPGLPPRLSVFGVATLPPIFLRLVVALARHLPVAIYFVSPTYHYWGDLRSEREAERVARRLRRPEPLAELHFEEGHPLLAALGRQGRDFFNLLQEADAAGDAWHELDFVSPATDTVLGRLQADVLHLADRGRDAASLPVPLDPADDSLRVHVCHSPMRELEVIRDQILTAFAADPGLRPHDVVVMVPDVGRYGPYVEAVFGVAHEGAPGLPYSIADHPAGRQQPPAETILQVLDLAPGRLPPQAVFDLLDVAAIRRAAGLAESELPTLRAWVREAGVRWAVDGDERRREFGLPGEEGNTWRAGLDRLLMGYAAGDREELVAGVLPRAGSTAGDADLLGRLAAFAETLFRELRALRRPRPLGEWAAALHHALDALYLPEGEDEEQGLMLVRAAVDRLATAGELARAGAVSLAAVRAHLEAQLAEEGFGSGFLSGRITFCALKPMRTIPFRVVCVAGLDDASFPRRDPRRGFDLIARDPRPGDRSLAADDRYLFLETLLAARDRLVLTYVGRSQRDGGARPPSVVVSELLGVLDRAFASPDGRPPREHLVVEHPLQAYGPAYFDGRDPRLRSFSREAFDAARALVAEPRPEPPFVAAEPAAPAETPAGPAAGDTLELTLRDLTEFWVHPAKHYCRRVLDLRLGDAEPPAEDAEPFALDGLGRYRLGQWLLERRLRDDDPADDPGELELVRGRGEIPLAGLGRAVYARLERETRSFARRLPAHRPRPPIEIELEGAGFRLTGELEDLTDQGLLRFRCATRKNKDLVRAWVLHVVHNAWARRHAGRGPLETRVVALDGCWRFAPLAEPATLLEALVDGYRKGLERPLPLFERASFAYADQKRRLADPASRSHASPLDRARQAWRGRGERRWGDAEDPYVALCFRGHEPLASPSFAVWAEYLWGPLLESAEELEP